MTNLNEDKLGDLVELNMVLHTLDNHQESRKTIKKLFLKKVNAQQNNNVKQRKIRKRKERKAQVYFHCGERGHISLKYIKLKEDLKDRKVVRYERTTIKKRIKGKTTMAKRLCIRESDVMRKYLEVSVV